MKKKDLNYIYLLRIIGSIGIIMIHVTAFNWYSNKVDFNWQVNNSLNLLSHWAIPLFIFISGHIFLGLKKDFTIKDFYLKYIPNLILIILIWGIIYGFYQYNNFSIQIFKNILKDIITGKAFIHLWYLYMLIGLYVVTPILKIFVNKASKSEFLYYLFISTLIMIIIPHFFSIWKFRAFESLFNSLYIEIFNGYVYYYMLGGFMFKYDFTSKQKKLIYLLTVSITIITIAFTILMSNYNEIATTYFSGTFSPISLMLLLSIFLLSKKVTSNIKANNLTILKEISSLTMGIYLIHFYIVNLFGYNGLNSNFINPIIGAPLIAIIIFTISLIVSFVISKVPFLKFIIKK